MKEIFEAIVKIAEKVLKLSQQQSWESRCKCPACHVLEVGSRPCAEHQKEKDENSEFEQYLSVLKKHCYPD